MRNSAREFLRGARTITPVLIGVIPFSLVFGFAMKNAAFPASESTFFSLSMIAGASQLAAVQLKINQNPAFIIIITAVIINLRYSMYSLSLKPVMKNSSYIIRLFTSFCMTDQSYGFTMAEFEKDGQNDLFPFFFLGASSVIYYVWHASVFLGYNIGAAFTARTFLDFVILMIFMLLLIPHLGGNDRKAAAIVFAVASIILFPLLPLQTGPIAAIITGICTGITWKFMKYKTGGEHQ
jgi:predicted branched-subunit amino acid permease